MRMLKHLKRKIQTLLEPGAERRRRWISAILFTLVIGGTFAVVWFSPAHMFLGSPDALRSAVAEKGALAPIAMVSIHIAQVILAPIPGQAIEIANGYIFGWLWGSVLSLLGTGIGTVLAIYLAKKFGRPLVEILITRPGLLHIRRYMRSKNQVFFFVLFLLPGTPDDLLCFAIGLSSIPMRRAIAIGFFGRIPGVIASVIFGATGAHLSPLEFTLWAVVVSVALWLLIFHTRLHKKMTRFVE